MIRFNNRGLKSAFSVLFLAVLICFPAIAEDTANNPDSETSIPSDKKIVPVFPKENSSLIFIEAESAVSTNFNLEPTLNYSCSSSRTLQLSRYTGLQGGAPFFAEYVFYIEKPGTYTFWFGGSPPGPKEDIYPSYASPFSYKIDQLEPVSIHREDVIVEKGYTPSYYWNKVNEIFLESGMHKIRFEINEKRRFDGRFYFYLDCFFFINNTELELSGDLLPEVFPTALTGTLVDQPFWSISFYENFIDEHPENINAYIELSLVYSLLGDYINAIKYLNKAVLIEPDNPYPVLLIAKNRIWKGDIDEGLRSYRQILENEPGRDDIRSEAGKVSAWVGRYDDSLSLYKDGLDLDEDNLNYRVNLGIVNLWLSQTEEAEENFQKALDTASISTEKLKELGSIYTVNGYEDKAIPVYLHAIKLFPENLEFYMLLEEGYRNIGNEEKAREIHSQTLNAFESSERLISYMDLFKEKQGLKQNLIDNYNSMLIEQPDNLQLREMLVQTYFWNGMREQAITEYMNILTNHAYRHFSKLEKNSVDILKLKDFYYLYKNYFSTFSASITEKTAKLRNLLTAYNKAEKNNTRFQEKKGKAAENGETLAIPEEGDPAIILREAESNLADEIAGIKEVIERFSVIETQCSLEIEAITELIEKEKKEADAFTRMTGPLSWRWNRAEMISELETVSASGIWLADYTLGKIYQTEGLFELATERFSAIIETEKLDSEKRSLGEIYLWQELTEEGLGYLNENTPETGEDVLYINEVTALAAELELKTVSSGLFTSNTTAETSEISNTLELLRSRAVEMGKELQYQIDILFTIMSNRMERTIFGLQQDTYLLRYELGDYLLSEGDLVAATSQFSQVLMVDPWNTSAIYKLGTVRQLYGDWHQAMKKYKQVFYVDPNYENTANYYNMLAKNNADTLKFLGSVMGDSSSLVQHGEASFSTNLNTAFSFNIDYKLDSTRIYNVFPVTGYIGDPVLTTHQVHSVFLDVPVNIHQLGLIIKPIAGLSIISSLYDNFPGIPEDPSISIPVFFSTLFASPGIGGEIIWSIPDLSVSGKYFYEQHKETFIPNRRAVFSHSGELNVNFNIPFPASPAFNGIFGRTYAKVSVLSDENFMGLGVLDLGAGFHIADTPWTTLNLLGTVSFEHSLSDSGLSIDNSVANYYTPEGVLLAKLGLAGSTWIGIGDGDVIGLSFRLAAGTYVNTIFSEPDSKLYLDGDLRFEYGKGLSSYFISIYGSGSFPAFPEPDYWSLFIQFGYNAKLPELLTK